MNPPKVSVIILNWNGGDYLLRCLESVSRTKYPKELLEVIVVDNGSTDGSADRSKEAYGSIRLLKNRENLGFCGGNNIGIQAASGDLVVLLNNDTIVDEGWIEELVRATGDPRVGIAGCRLCLPGTEVIQTLGSRMLFPGYWQSLGTGKTLSQQAAGPLDVDFVSGAAIAIKKEVLEKVGLLDTSLSSFDEDLDLCLRVKEAGYRIVSSNAIVFHFGSASWGKMPLKKAFLIYRNHLYLIRRHFAKNYLIFYVFGYLPRSLRADSVRFMRGRNSLRLASFNRAGYERRSVVEATGTYLLRISFFSIALAWVIVRGFRPIDHSDIPQLGVRAS